MPGPRIDWSKTLLQYEIPTVVKDRLLRPYFEQAELKDPVLDIGCGTGYFSYLLARRGLRVAGIDINSELENQKDFEFYKKDILHFKTTRKFETLLLINILSTLPTQDRALVMKQVKNLKTENGLAYVVNTSSKLYTSEINSNLIAYKRLKQDMVSLKVNLLDGRYIEFEDYIIDSAEMENLTIEAGLQLQEKAEFVLDKIPIYEMQLLR